MKIDKEHLKLVVGNQQTEWNEVNVYLHIEFILCYPIPKICIKFRFAQVKKQEKNIWSIIY